MAKRIDQRTNRRHQHAALSATCLGLLVMLGVGICVQAAPAQVAASGISAVYPVKVSDNKRYLVDQRGTPFLIVGDTPQGLMSRLSEKEADEYFANRQAHEFNTVGWIDVACAGHDFPTNLDASTPNGIRPFTGYLPGGKDFAHYDLSKPNEAYFSRLDKIVVLAGNHGILVFIDPIETIGWLPTLRNNGPAAARAYGEYLGSRYKRFPNVAWLNGNDFNTWKDVQDDSLVQAVSNGIRTTDPKHIQTVELNVFNSSSYDDPTWVPLAEINSTYAYSPTYIQMLHSYNQTPVAPTYLVEAHYDLEDAGKPPDYGYPPVLRREEYWTMLTGGTGQFYGNAYTWSFKSGWETHLDTPGVMQLTIWKKFFATLPWQDLVPDQDHSVLVAGMGNYGDLRTRVSQAEYSTAAKTSDGSIVVVYMPTARSITLNMASLKGAAYARWFDPTNGRYTTIRPEPFENQGIQQFTPPAKNHDRDSDWVLVLSTQRI
ncbi:hypothetical protein ACPOL_7089 (plasmid) [Acidisarcina polymorpha]|uniref:DUF4038 domain-containing protein n=1 Tax=Acidisarcina polymorpha TaxID=2211140 RepID=A0A2Z5GAZ7_9BACT|nr:DUF4038 domain-containing protein [Acidisarcina polymorpha]AXC16281.1 hypothetical protein ACPOL_7089 [Acidisarcina polymorpha]